MSHHSAEPLSMGQLLEEAEAVKEPQWGELVEGVIMHVDTEGLLVHFGGKVEGRVPLDHMHTLSPGDRRSLQVGQRVSVCLLQSETDREPALLSLDRARREVGWQRLEQALEHGETVTGKAVGRNRGGVVVDIDGVEGFVPASQLAPKGGWHAEEAPQASPEGADQQLRLKVLELDRHRRRAVLSERASWQEWREARKQQLLTDLREGEVRRGRIAGLSNFGAFVDLGGADGLVHLSELSWRPVASAQEVVQVGQEVDVQVLRVDREGGRISLSLRRLQPEPWSTLTQTYHEGQIVTGTITNITPYGAFARIDGVVDGLIHISELSSRRVTHPRDVVKEGDVVELKILRMDPERRRLGLSLKQAVEER